MAKKPVISAVGKMLEAYRTRKGLTKQEVATALGVSYSYVNNAERGRFQPTADRLRQFIEVLGLTSAEAETMQSMTAIARSPEDVRQWLKDKVGISVPLEGVERIDSVRVPIVGRCPAGDPKLFTDGDYPPGFAEEYFPMPAAVREADSAAFLLRITGDSMLPTLKDGDLVLVSPGTELRPDKPCVFKIDDECGCKLWCPVKDEVILRPLNKEYPERRLMIADITWAYPVIKAVVNL